MSASRSRQKRKLEPISIEELAGTTGMSGFCSFLTRDTSVQVAVPALDRIESSAPDRGAAEASAVVAAAPDTGPLEAAAPVLPALVPEYGKEPASVMTETGAPETLVVERDAPDTGAVESIPRETGAPEEGDFRYRRRPRVREARTVEDGHSLAEQAVYDAMFRAGKPYRGDSRILTIGLRTLAELSRMAYSNCKANVRSLVTKLALEELPGFSYTDGRTYIIHSYPEILRRRREAGLTHVLRTRGVAFVEPQSGATESTASQAGAPDSTPLELTAALRRYHPDLSADAVAAFWARCRDVWPSATAADVVPVVDLKAGKPGMIMPFSFLLSAVPKALEQRPRFTEDSAARDRLFAAEILRNPEADEEQLEWARSIVG